MSTTNRKLDRNTEILSLKSRFLEVNKHKGTLLKLTPNFWHLLYLEETVGSFINEYHISSIVTASAMVECCLFFEYLRRNPKFQVAGTTVPERVGIGIFIKYFREKEVPLDCLLDRHESLTKRPNELNYVRNRNKYAHGDIWRTIRNPSLDLPVSNEALEYGIGLDEYFHQADGKRGLENRAYIHLKKSLNFMIQFTEYLRKKEGIVD
jgi:hypothetical protein